MLILCMWARNQRYQQTNALHIEDLDLLGPAVRRKKLLYSLRGDTLPCYIYQPGGISPVSENHELPESWTARPFPVPTFKT